MKIKLFRFKREWYNKILKLEQKEKAEFIDNLLTFVFENKIPNFTNKSTEDLWNELFQDIKNEKKYQINLLKMAMYE